MTTAVIIIFVVLFVLSVLGQIDSKTLTWLKAHDPLSVIPRWTFFAPRPGTTDYHLVFQVFQDSESGTWHEEQLADRRTIWGAFWNPLKRNKKVLSDSVRSLGRLSRELDQKNLWQVQYTVPYIAALKFLSGRPHPPSATHIRFMILESDGFYPEWEPRLLFSFCQTPTQVRE